MSVGAWPMGAGRVVRRALGVSSLVSARASLEELATRARVHRDELHARCLGPPSELGSVAAAGWDPPHAEHGETLADHVGVKSGPAVGVEEVGEAPAAEAPAQERDHGGGVLLASDQGVDLSCVIRTDSPAIARFVPEILYIPPVWVEEHAKDIKTSRPLGTGEHDYALLRIKETLLGSPLSSSFPFIPIDAREAIGFVDDQVLVASYPAEFIGGMTAQLGLYPVTSITTIKGLLTFGEEGTVDIVSIGGVIGAQSGSSGGAIVNAWGRLIGLISTTSEGATTDERDLRAVTMSYINSDILAQSGLDLGEILAGDVATEAYAFNTVIAPALRKLLIDQISQNSR